MPPPAGAAGVGAAHSLSKVAPHHCEPRSNQAQEDQDKRSTAPLYDSIHKATLPSCRGTCGSITRFACSTQRRKRFSSRLIIRQSEPDASCGRRKEACFRVYLGLFPILAVELPFNLNALLCGELHRKRLPEVLYEWVH